MRIQEDTQPERGVRIHDLIRGRETWRGIILKVKDGSDLEKIAEDLGLILCQEGYLPPKRIGNVIYSKGQYSDGVVEKIKEYLSLLDGAFEEEPIIAEGNHDNFLSDRWLNKIINPAYKH